MEHSQIHSIYQSTEGEGLFIGLPQVFVRFQGCAVGCVNCDSKETWDFSSKQANLIEIVEKVESFGLKRVSITGGDPLHPKNEELCFLVAKCLKGMGYFVNIEAAGTRVVPKIFDLVDYISFDVKTPSTQVKFNEKVLSNFINNYSHKSQIKAVIQDQKDFSFYLELKLKYPHYQNWIATPCYEPKEKFPQKRMQDLLQMNLDHGGEFRVIGQQHKWFFGADAKDV